MGGVGRGRGGWVGGSHSCEHGVLAGLRAAPAAAQPSAPGPPLNTLPGPAGEVRLLRDQAAAVSDSAEVTSVYFDNPGGWWLSQHSWVFLCAPPPKLQCPST